MKKFLQKSYKIRSFQKHCIWLMSAAMVVKILLYGVNKGTNNLYKLLKTVLLHLSEKILKHNKKIKCLMISNKMQKSHVIQLQILL